MCVSLKKPQFMILYGLTQDFWTQGDGYNRSCRGVRVLPKLCSHLQAIGIKCPSRNLVLNHLPPAARGQVPTLLAVGAKGVTHWWCFPSSGWCIWSPGSFHGSWKAVLSPPPSQRLLPSCWLEVVLSRAGVVLLATGGMPWKKTGKVN